MEEYDFIVIGAGVAGLAASMYAARLGMKTLCLGASSGSELPVGGVITTTNLVDNYPGFTNVSGDELADRIRSHAASYPLVTIKEEKAEDVRQEGGKFILKAEKQEYAARSLLFATGTMWKKLDVPGSKELENKGVVYCALCDAPLFKGKTVAVIGGSDSAIKDALVAAEHASKVYIIYRGNEIRAEEANAQRVRKNPKIEIITGTNVTRINGSKAVSSVSLDKPYKGNETLEAQGVFVAIGHIPLSMLAEKMGVRLNEKKEIIIDHRTSETNIPGVFAAGDVADKPFKQAITGVAEGCTAAYSAHEYISKVPTTADK